jgi:uncharacterized protein (DUF1778 family)
MDELRTTTVTTRVTPREKELVQLAARAAGETVSTFTAGAAVRAARAEIFAAGLEEDHR